MGNVYGELRSISNIEKAAEKAKKGKSRRKEVAAYYKEHPAYSLEIVNVFVARSKHLGSYNLMMAQNPVYVMTALKKED